MLKRVLRFWVCTLSVLFVAACGGSGTAESTTAGVDTDTAETPAASGILAASDILVAPNLADQDDRSYRQNAVIAALIFTNNGGESLSSCSADSLPVGLTVEVSTDGSSCEIAGTPTVIQAQTTHTVRATNLSGASDATISIAVVLGGALDVALFDLIEEQGLTGDPSVGRTLASIDDSLADLGKALFFAKNLGGQQDTACVSCHHPSLGGTDQLSLPVGVDAVNSTDTVSPDLLGLGRFHNGDLLLVPRNAPTVFNLGLWDSGLFWDSRVQSEDLLNATDGARGTAAGIMTPDSAVAGVADANLPNGVSIANAQARFPVTAESEMRGTFAPAEDNQTLRASLAARLDDTTLGWNAMFDAAFGDEDIDFNRIAEAISAYEESMLFINNPWKSYVQGELDAITDQQKEGAILFFTSSDDNGGGCSECHTGDFFTDEDHHVVGFPQIGPGLGDDSSGDGDFGRARVTADNGDRYHFRTPSLLNLSVTAPYGHAGVYASLDQVLDHYDNPRGEAGNFFAVNINDATASFDGAGDYCDLPQIEGLIAKTGQSCLQVYNRLNPNAIVNTDAALDFRNAAQANSPLDNINLNNGEKNDIVAFLAALIDPCVENRTCLAPWIIDVADQSSYPDGFPLIAVDENGVGL